MDEWSSNLPDSISFRFIGAGQDLSQNDAFPKSSLTDLVSPEREQAGGSQQLKSFSGEGSECDDLPAISSSDALQFP
ncbi:hypothetical protein N7451_012387 [Penicillium sp. IBT 35674x]|nr:hypothetical protein N7451_012387 [Penicillium sp. IBT 35674x]